MLNRVPPDERVLIQLKPIEQPKPKETNQEDPAKVLPVDGPPAAALVPPEEETGKGEIAFEKQTHRATQLRMAPVGQRLVSTMNKSIIVWDVKGKILHRLQEGDNGGIVDLSISADGTKCATIRADGTACVWYGPPEFGDDR